MVGERAGWSRFEAECCFHEFRLGGKNAARSIRLVSTSFGRFKGDDV